MFISFGDSLHQLQSVPCPLYRDYKPTQTAKTKFHSRREGTKHSEILEWLWERPVSPLHVWCISTPVESEPHFSARRPDRFKSNWGTGNMLPEAQWIDVWTRSEPEMCDTSRSTNRIISRKLNLRLLQYTIHRWEKENNR